MAILSMLLAVSEPKGMWESIIKAFEGALGNYILAIILLTVIIKLIWSPLDTIQRKMNNNMAQIQAKMQPELNKLQEKYGKNPQLLKQKQNELQKKYSGNTMGSCLFMLAYLALNMTIFFTLWTGLNAIATFKISENYENLKYEYANCLDVTNSYLALNEENKEKFVDFDKLEYRIFEVPADGDTPATKKIGLRYKDAEEGEYLFSQEYKTDYSTGEGEDFQESNVYIVNLINTLITPEEEVVLVAEVKEGEEVIQNKLTLAEAIQNVAMNNIVAEYERTKDNFLWIQNIWVADSPFQKSIFDFKTFKSRVGAKNLGADEEVIYNSFMTPLRAQKNAVNGYLILPLLCIVATLLSLFFSRKKNKSDQPQAAGGKVMMFIMPIIFGLFALFYNAVFAIYMFVSQFISALLIPVQNWIVGKWQNHSDNKKKKNYEVAEYSRKF